VGHSVSLITTIAVALGVALLLGFIAVKLRLPALVGYLVAGVMIGPATPGFVADVELSGQLAEIGVMLLMFGVGLHFSLDELLAVKRIALPGAVAQIVVATLLGFAMTTLWGWSLASGIVFGLALSVASTVVLLRALEDRGQLETINGRIAVGWLVVEDLVMVLVLVLLPALAGPLGTGHGGVPAGAPEQSVWKTLGITMAQVAGFIVLMLVAGRRVLPWLLWRIGRTGSRELFTLSVVSAAVGIAYGAAVMFGVSFALGAFFAGMVMRESALSHRAAADTLPLRDAFSVLFFVSMGMLFDPQVLVDHPARAAAVLGIIIFGKSIAAFLIVLAFRYPINTALTVSASLAQIGEFSFILAGLGVSLKILPPEGQGLIVAGALLSIAINPFVFDFVGRLQKWFREHSMVAGLLERTSDPLAELPTTVELDRLHDHVVVAGYGRVGRRIGEALIERGVPIVVAEQNRDVVDQLRKRGIAAVSGDAAEAEVLIQAHIARASMLVIATPDAVRARRMIDIARTLRPTIDIVVRTHTDEAAELLARERVGRVFMGEHELALSMVRHVLDRIADRRFVEEREREEPEV
jgi:CPA2 family monovalent cation:H+ antiporter-2